MILWLFLVTKSIFSVMMHDAGQKAVDYGMYGEEMVQRLNYKITLYGNIPDEL